MLVARHLKWVSLPLLLSLIFTTLFISGCNKKKAHSKMLPARAIKTYTVKAASGSFTRLFSGVVRPVLASELSFLVNGKIVMLQYKLGRYYKTGAILAQLDKQQFLLDQLARNAQLKKAQALMIASKQKYLAKKSLYENTHLSRLDYQSAKANYEVSISEVQLAKAQADIATADLDDANLKAPFNGVVSRVYVDNHMTVRSGTPIIKFEGVKEFDVTLGIPDNLIGDIKLDDKVVIDLDQSATPIEGSVMEISASSNQSYVYPVVVKLLNPPVSLKPGITAEVTFTLKHKNHARYFLIPINAILPTTDKKGMFVYRYNANTQLVSRQMIYAASINNNMAEVQKGLAQGDIIAISGVRFLHDGQKVSLYQES